MCVSRDLPVLRVPLRGPRTWNGREVGGAQTDKGDWTAGEGTAVGKGRFCLQEEAVSTLAAWIVEGEGGGLHDWLQGAVSVSVIGHVWMSVSK